MGTSYLGIEGEKFRLNLGRRRQMILWNMFNGLKRLGFVTPSIVVESVHFFVPKTDLLKLQRKVQVNYDNEGRKEKGPGILNSPFM